MGQERGVQSGKGTQARSHQSAAAQKNTLRWYSTFGLVEVRERIWRYAGASYMRAFATRLDHILVDFGCEHSFAQASQRVLEHYGFEISPSVLRRATLEHAQRAQQLLEKEYRRSYRSSPETGSEHVIAQVDGTMLCTVKKGKRNGKRPREWHEIRLAAAQAKGNSRSDYAATFGSVGEVDRRWGHCARDAGRGLNSRVHCVGDGAQWIQLQSKEVFADQGHFLCDFYHVSEYLSEAAAVCRPENPKRWRKTQQARLRRGSAGMVLKELEKHLEVETISDEEAPVRKAHRYMNNRLLNMDYAGAMEMDLPIGSGLIESGHWHVLQARLKKAGAAWLSENAEKWLNCELYVPITSGNPFGIENSSTQSESHPRKPSMAIHSCIKMGIASR